MEPIIKGLAPAAIATAITAAANFLKAFGIADITQAQIDALNGIAPYVILVLTLFGAKFARDRVTPVEAPRLDAGTQVEVITPGQEPNPTVTL